MTLKITQGHLNCHCSISHISLPIYWSVIRRLGLAMTNMCTKFEISISIRYEDRKGDEKIENGVVWELWVAQGNSKPFNRVHTRFYILAFYSNNCPYLSLFLRYSETLVENR